MYVISRVNASQNKKEAMLHGQVTEIEGKIFQAIELTLKHTPVQATGSLLLLLW